VLADILNREARMKTTGLSSKHHRGIEGLLHRLVDPGGGDKRALLEEPAGTVAAHTTIEQGPLDPAMLRAAG